MSLLLADKIFVGSSDGASLEGAQYLPLKWGNRHGLVAGATGTGKTVTLQALAEGFSDAGVPVFLADIKGDLGGICQPSEGQDFLKKRAEDIGFAAEYKPRAYSAVFWDLFAEKGHPVRTTIAELGPLLLSRILDLNDTQEGVLNIAFRVAEEEGLALLDLKDLRSFLADLAERKSELSTKYGNISPQSIGAIQRNLLVLEDQGADKFFGEPALDVQDFMKTDLDGKGHINILAADRLMNAPRLYGTFLLWLLSELFEMLPEAGDLSKPKLVFFFDEAHLLFNDAPKSLLEKIEQVVRLIRSKGVGVFFVTQNPDDVPETVLSQLGNRFQHALRAFTPAQQKAIKNAAQTYRANPAFKVEEAITALGTGEALFSTLDEKGQPTIVQKTLIRPPSTKLGPASAEALRMAQQMGGFGAKYGTPIDRESAHEILQKRVQEKAQTAEREKTSSAKSKSSGGRASNRQGVGEAAVKSIVRSISSSIGRMIVQEIKRSLTRKR